MSDPTTTVLGLTQPVFTDPPYAAQMATNLGLIDTAVGVINTALGWNVTNEVPTGTINGTNVTFTLAHTPAANSLRLYADGLRTTNYTLAGHTITMGVAPTTSLIADYR